MPSTSSTAKTVEVGGMKDRYFAVLFAFAAFGACSLVGCIFYGVYWVTQHVHVVVR